MTKTRIELHEWAARTEMSFDIVATLIEVIEQKLTLRAAVHRLVDYEDQLAQLITQLHAFEVELPAKHDPDLTLAAREAIWKLREELENARAILPKTGNALLEAEQRILASKRKEKERLEARKRAKPTPRPPATPRGGLCVSCGTRPRHFDDYCKRCVPDELRPTGKVA